MEQKKITVDVTLADMEGAAAQALTPLQHRFVMEYMKDKNGTAAAERAGCKGSKNTFKMLAHQMLRTPQVAIAIKEAEGKIIERATINRGDIINYFLDTADEARVAKKFDAAVKSYEKIAEILGILKKSPTKAEEDAAAKKQAVKPAEAFGSNGDSIDSTDVNTDVSDFLKMLNIHNKA